MTKPAPRWWLWINAIPHLHRQYWKEMLVLGICWGLFGAVVAYATIALMIQHGGLTCLD